MEKKHNGRLVPDVEADHFNFGIPMRWAQQVNEACTKWLRERGLYYECGMRELIHTEMSLKQHRRKQNKLDAIVDEIVDGSKGD
jgi:hypothetical protein